MSIEGGSKDGDGQDPRGPNVITFPIQKRAENTAGFTAVSERLWKTIPWDDASEIMWQQFLNGIADEAVTLTAQKGMSITSALREIANTFLACDAERVTAYLAQKNNHRSIAEALQAHIQASKDALGLFTFSFQGSSDTHAEQVTQAISLFEENYGEMGLRELAATGEEFSKKFPHVAEEVQRRLTPIGSVPVLRLRDKQEPGHTTRGRKAVATKLPGPRAVETETPDFGSLVSVLKRMEDVLDDMKFRSPAVNTIDSQNLRTLIERRVDGMCARGLDAVLDRCNELRRESHTHNMHESAHEYALLTHWLKQEQRKREREVIGLFLETSRLPSTAKQMMKYLSHSTGQLKTEREGQVRSLVGDLRAKSVGWLLSPEYQRQLNWGALFEPRIVALMQVLQERLRLLEMSHS